SINAGGGGGLRDFGGAVLTNTTLSGNSVTNLNGQNVGGGGIFVSGVLWLSNVTLSGNSASCEVFRINDCVGGALLTSFAHVEIKNSILANTPQGSGNCSINFGDVISHNHNLSDDATCLFSEAADLNSTAAGLDSAGLTDNGGPTRTIALLPTSVAVNAIPSTDCTHLNGAAGDTPQPGRL